MSPIATLVFMTGIAANVVGMATQQGSNAFDLDGLSFDEKMARLLERDAVLFGTNRMPKDSADGLVPIAAASTPAAQRAEAAQLPTAQTLLDQPGPAAFPPMVNPQLSSLQLGYLPPMQLQSAVTQLPVPQSYVEQVAAVPPQVGSEQAAFQPQPAQSYLGQLAPVPPMLLTQLSNLQLGRVSSPSQASSPSMPFISFAAVPTWDVTSAAGGEGGAALAMGSMGFPTATVVNISGLGPQLVLTALQSAEYAPDQFLSGTPSVANLQGERTLLQNSSNASSTGSSQSGVVGFVTMDGRLGLPLAVVLWGIGELVLILCCVRCCGSRRKGNLYQHGEEELFHL